MPTIRYRSGDEQRRKRGDMTTVTTERDGSAQALSGPAIPDLTLPQFVLCSANRRGSKRALVDAETGQEISYAGLADAVREIGAGLSARGLRPGDVLALCAPNSIEFAVAWFAAASIGAIVTTMNPQCTRDEIVRQLRQTGARWLVTTAGPAEQKLRGVAAETAITETIVTGDHAAGTIPFWSRPRPRPRPRTRRPGPYPRRMWRSCRRPAAPPGCPRASSSPTGTWWPAWARHGSSTTWPRTTS
jgi:acyl-CoA synthetase (AMP-forming)/AMP-acid ligase II